MERADLMQQGIGPAEAREDDEAQHQAAELEWALTKMERAITRWETATQQINQAFELMGEATPLCPFHHRGQEGIHTLGKNRWERRYMTQDELLAETQRRLQEAM